MEFSAAGAELDSWAVGLHTQCGPLLALVVVYIVKQIRGLYDALRCDSFHVCSAAYFLLVSLGFNLPLSPSLSLSLPSSFVVSEKLVQVRLPVCQTRCRRTRFRLQSNGRPHSNAQLHFYGMSWHLLFVCLLHNTTVAIKFPVYYTIY